MYQLGVHPRVRLMSKSGRGHQDGATPREDSPPACRPPVAALRASDQTSPCRRLRGLGQGQPLLGLLGWPVVRPASRMKQMGSFLWEGLSLNQGHLGVKASGGAWGAVGERVVGPPWSRQTLVTDPSAGPWGWPSTASRAQQARAWPPACNLGVRPVCCAGLGGPGDDPGFGCVSVA